MYWNTMGGKKGNKSKKQKRKLMEQKTKSKTSCPPIHTEQN